MKVLHSHALPIQPQLITAKEAIAVREQYKEKQIRVVYFEESQPRSLTQNAYYKGIILADMSEQTGYETFECDMILKDMFGLKQQTEVQNRVIEQFKSTALYTKAEMSDFIDKIIRWASSVGIDIRDPKHALTMEQYMELVEQNIIKLK
jgi:hypothetical protein